MRKACLSLCVTDSAGVFSFLGALILEAVVTELATLHRLSTASDVYLAGTRCVLLSSQLLVILYIRVVDLSAKCRFIPRVSAERESHR